MRSGRQTGVSPLAKGAVPSGLLSRHMGPSLQKEPGMGVISSVESSPFYRFFGSSRGKFMSRQQVGTPLYLYVLITNGLLSYTNSRIEFRRELLILLGYC